MKVTFMNLRSGPTHVPSPVDLMLRPNEHRPVSMTPAQLAAIQASAEIRRHINGGAMRFHVHDDDEVVAPLPVEARGASEWPGAARGALAPSLVADVLDDVVDGTDGDADPDEAPASALVQATGDVADLAAKVANFGKKKKGKQKKA